jgi:hypothetical protein
MLSVLVTLAPTSGRAGEPGPADAHAEMAAALEQQADLVPAPPILLGQDVAPTRQEQPPVHKAGRPASGAAERDARARSGRETREVTDVHGDASRAAAEGARQARSAAEGAARQEAAKRAKDRATQHPHPSRP